MSSSSNATSTDVGDIIPMKPYLHFTPGDVVLFKPIMPTTPAAVFAACLVTFLLALFSRYAASVARGVNFKSAARAKHLLHLYHLEDEGKVVDIPHARFFLSHDLSRAAILGTEVFLHYTLMLIAMTFNAAYIISLVIGGMIGEFIFGRLNRLPV